MSPLSHSDPNSLAAAASVRKTAPAQRERVFRAVELFGAAAEWEIADHLGLGGNSVRPRLVELVAEGRIERKGKSKTPSGRACWLYVVKARPIVLVQEKVWDLA